MRKSHWDIRLRVSIDLSPNSALISSSMSELTLENLTDDGNYARAENKMILDELERKKKARSMAVPTDDTKVRARLREIGEPITLFGERVCFKREFAFVISCKARLLTAETD